MEAQRPDCCIRIAATFFYVFIGASLAELASAIPSSAATSTSLITANTIIAMYSLYHPDYSPQRWQIFLAFLILTWIDCSIVMFGQRYLAKVASLCAGICMAGVFVTILVCAIVPGTSHGTGYASKDFVWTQWNNQTGYTSDGFVFLAGMLNGAFAIGTPDGVCHLAEEIPDPKRNIPKGIVAQLTTGFISTFFFYLAVLYSITSMSDVFATNIVSLPLAAIYQQATNSKAGTVGLLVIFLLNTLVTLPGAYVAASRNLWTLGRDGATPFSSTLGRVSPRWRNPFNATFVCGCCVTVLGCIYIGSVTAFNAFVGVFAILTTMSYLAAILPHLLTRRRYVKPGPFWMPGVWGYIVAGIACAYIIVFNVIYCFPYALPTTAVTMNYSSLMAGGLTVFLAFLYLWKRSRGYIGPRVALDASDDIIKGIVGLESELMASRKSAVVQIVGGETRQRRAVL
ncbi:hypothetical protein LTR28_009222 [Elasticomyces elasticus]|nr:hypothetical protein LTR28_009222 [Elasticomyces elasticus]